MERKKYDEVAWYRANLFGMIVFVTENRIDRRDLPGSPYVYELRHDDDGDWTTPVEICNSVLVNFCMTLVSFEPLPINLKYHYVTIEHGDFWMRPDTKYNLEALEKHYRGSRFNIPPDRIHHYTTNLFISQPFTGKDIKEIKKQRKLLHELYALYVNRPIEDIILIDQLDVVDEYDIEGHFDTSDDRSFYQLCRSVGMMKNADVVIFYGEWYKSKGACIEHSICQTYHKISVENDELIEFCKNNPKYDDDYFMPLWKKKFFDMHDIADVNIFKDPKGGFKATAELNCNGYTAMGDTPNDAYLNLYDMLDNE